MNHYFIRSLRVITKDLKMIVIKSYYVSPHTQHKRIIEVKVNIMYTFKDFLKANP